MLRIEVNDTLHTERRTLCTPPTCRQIFYRLSVMPILHSESDTLAAARILSCGAKRKSQAPFPACRTGAAILDLHRAQDSDGTYTRNHTYMSNHLQFDAISCQRAPCWQPFFAKQCLNEHTCAVMIRLERLYGEIGSCPKGMLSCMSARPGGHISQSVWRHENGMHGYSAALLP